MTRLLLVIFFLYSSAILSEASSKTINSQGPQKKILCLGDSFTVGTGLGEGLEEGAFPYQLVKQLQQAGYDVAVPKLYATDGDTTKHLLGALNTAEPLSNPDNPKARSDDFDLVILSIGINDLFRGHSEIDYAHHFSELLKRAIQFAKNDPSRVVVLSIPAWDASPSVFSKEGLSYREKKYEAVRKNVLEVSIPIKDLIYSKKGEISLKDSSLLKDKIARAQAYNIQAGIAREIDLFNQAAQEIIRKENSLHQKRLVHFMDLTSVTREEAKGPQGQPDARFFAKDGIHYSKEMYAKWVALILPTAKKIMDYKS